MPIEPMQETRPSYYPFRADIDQRVRENSVTHLFSATAYPVTGDPIPLDVTAISLTFDESWSPYAQADLTIKAIEDQATLDRLDARFNCRVKITLGYGYDAKDSESYVVADLHLRTRKVNRPGNEIVITAVSDEAKLQDRKFKPNDGAPPKTGLNELVLWLAQKGNAPEDAVVVSQYSPGYGVNYLTELALEVGQEYGSLIQDVMNRTNTWIRCDGDRRWRITQRSEVAGVSAHKMMTGVDGTITASEVELQREAYANNVVLKYVWKNAANDDVIIYGTAQVPGTGKHGVDAIGFNTYFEERTGPISQFAANAAAETVLKYKITRGRGMRIDAVAAYWLRPGMTVTIQLPTGDQERHLVRAVTFNPGSGHMSVTTRQPETI